MLFSNVVCYLPARNLPLCSKRVRLFIHTYCRYLRMNRYRVHAVAHIPCIAPVLLGGEGGGAIAPPLLMQYH